MAMLGSDGRAEAALRLLGVTGVREQLAASAELITKRLKAITDTPVIVASL